MTRDFSRWKLRISRLYLLEAPEAGAGTKLGEEDYRGGPSFSRIKGREADLGVSSLRRGAGGTITLCPVSPHPGKGLRLSRRCQQLGSVRLEFLQMNSQFCFWRGRPEWWSTLCHCMSPGPVTSAGVEITKSCLGSLERQEDANGSLKVNTCLVGSGFCFRFSQEQFLHILLNKCVLNPKNKSCHFLVKSLWLYL